MESPKFKVGDFVVCQQDQPGELSKMTAIKTGQKYRVLAIYRDTIMVSDGTNGYWHQRRFTKYKDTFGESIAHGILSQIKIEELIAKRGRN